MSKVIAVVGATGIQGGSVVNALLNTGEWKVRGLTRNVNSEKAKQLTAKGVEMVPADLNDEATLVKAFEGATAIFAVSDFFDQFLKIGAEAASKFEYKQGVNLAEAALQTPTLKHYIWSSLPNAGKISGGKFSVPHFQSKANIDEFIKSKPDLLAKTTFQWVTWYASNIFYPPLRPHHLKAIGKYVYIQPISPSSLVSVAGDVSVNVGVFVKAILSNPSKTLGKYVVLKTEDTTNGDLLQLWSKVTGKQVHYLQVSLEEYEKLFPLWGEEIGVSLKFWEYAGERSFSGEPGILTPADLGVEGELVGLEKYIGVTDWSSFD